MPRRAAISLLERRETAFPFDVGIGACHWCSRLASGRLTTVMALRGTGRRMMAACLPCITELFERFERDTSALKHGLALPPLWQPPVVLPCCLCHQCHEEPMEPRP
jgi:hypothetical protein